MQLWPNTLFGAPSNQPFFWVLFVFFQVRASAGHDGTFAAESTAESIAVAIAESTGPQVWEKQRGAKGG